MESFRFTSLQYDYVPTERGRPPQLWLKVSTTVPSSLYIGALLRLDVRAVSLVFRPQVDKLFTGALVEVADIVGKRIKVTWLSSEGLRRAEGFDPFFGESFGLYVSGQAFFAPLKPQSRVPDSSYYDPAYYYGKISTQNPRGQVM